MVAFGLLIPAGAPAAEVRPFIELAGTLERFPADARAALGEEFVPHWSQLEDGGFEWVSQRNVGGTAIAVPEARQLWQFYPPYPSQAKTGMVVRDLDTMRIVKTLVLPETFARTATSSWGGDWTHAVDPDGQRLFLLGCSCASGNEDRIYEIDLRSFGVKKREAFAEAMPANFHAEIRVGGLTYDRFADDLILLYGGPAGSSALNSNAFLYRMDVSGPPAEFEITKLYKLRACTGPFGSLEGPGDTYDWEVLVTRDHLYVPCMRAGHTVIVVKTARPDGNSASHREDVAAGPVYGETVLADQNGGRLFAVSVTGQEIWAFEAATMAFVGVVATGPSGTNDATAFGLDRGTGRVFFQSPTFGLGVVEGRFFPIPQARTHPHRARTQERILSDAATNRVLVLQGHGVKQDKPDSYRVYRVDPAPVPPSPPDPDRNTADILEREGVTESRYNASSSGYGTRVLLARGYATVVPAPTAGSLAPTAGVVRAVTRNACGETDRDLFAGRVAKAEYDTGSTAASAVAADVDETTRQDLNQPRCGLPSFLPGFVNWHYKPAACSSSTGEAPKEPSRGDNGSSRDLGPSEVVCPLPGGALRAHAETRTTQLAAAQADHSLTTVTLERVPGLGVRSTVESVARGVSVAVPEVGLVTIGEIRSKAVSSANGRPQRKEMSTHHIEIHHVRAAGEAVCEAACNLVELEERLNLLTGSRAVFRTGHGTNSGRDDGLVAGTPRGAQTAVQKSVARQASDRALVGDFTTEVPAFEVTVFNDTPEWGRARQIYQFAGVASSATYNVVVPPSLGTGLPQDSGLPGDFAPANPSLGTPFSGLVEQLEGSTHPLGQAAPATAAFGRDDDGEGGLAAVVRAMARGLRLFFTSPRTALLLLTAWALLGSPAVLSRRRRLLSGVQAP